MPEVKQGKVSFESSPPAKRGIPIKKSAKNVEWMASLSGKTRAKKGK
jgi:hypothetical protein